MIEPSLRRNTASAYCALLRTTPTPSALGRCPLLTAGLVWHNGDMNTAPKRRSYEAGHRRKMLVIVDESPEVDAALFFCASRIVHSTGDIVLLYVIEPQDFESFMGVRQVYLEEETTKAKALFRMFRRKLNTSGFENVATHEVIREGKTAEQITKLIEEDDDIAILVLGAAVDNKGPGPLVTSLATGKLAGTFPIPITVVPGDLTLEELMALA